MKHKRIKMFFYNHGAAMSYAAGVGVVALSIYALLSVDCSMGGSCMFASSGFADSVLPAR